MLGKLFKNHKILMIVCCLIPIAALGIFLILGFNSQAIVFLLILLCPLGHLFLMRGHGKRKDGHH